MDVDVAYSVCVQPRNFLTAGWDRKKFHIVWLFTSLNLLLYTTTVGGGGHILAERRHSKW